MKLKKILIFITIFFNCSILLFGQDPLIEGLFDPDVSVRRETIITIIEEELEDYIDYIEEAMFEQEEPFMIYKYLQALSILNSPNIASITNDFIELSDDFGEMRPAEDPLEMKVRATLILFDEEDYSTIDYIFELIQRDRPAINAFALTLLGRILTEVPGYSTTAKSELIYALNNSPDEISRFNAMFYLNEYFGADYLSDYLDKFINDPEITIRDQALRHLFNLNYQGLRNLLHQRLSQDPSEIMRAQIADSILTVYGEPSDLKAVIDYQPYEPDPDIQTWMEFLINDFIPPRITPPYSIPPVVYSLSDKIEIFISYTEDSFQYEWIEEETYNYYMDRLSLLLYEVEGGNLEEICRIIDEDLLERIEEDYSYGTLTIEGYKFLHYHTLYIREDVEDEFGSCDN
jgi:hypothetical protein